MSSTRLLILGCVRIFQPVHGYEIRRELESWSVADWTAIAYGSIYHALTSLARDGLLEVVGTEQHGRRPARTSYRLTPPGEEEYLRLLRDTWWRPKPLIDPFAPGLSFMADLPRDEVLAALEYRIQSGRAANESTRFMLDSPLMKEKPAVVAEMLLLSIARTEAEIAWTERLMERVQRGELP